MSKRYQGGILGVGFNPLQAPDAPTIGTATGGDTSASVTFTAPANVGGSAITSYVVQSIPGGTSATGASSPITVSGLTNGTAYTFRVTALNSYGPSPASAASNSVTPAIAQGQQAFTTAGTFSWVAPAGETSVSVVAVGGGGSAAAGSGGGGGELRYKNSITVVPGNSYSVVVGAGGVNGVSNGGASSFNSTSAIANGGFNNGTAGSGGTGDGGGNGGVGVAAASTYGSGGGAGGYAGAGGAGGNQGSPYAGGGVLGVAGSGGGGGGGSSGQNSYFDGGGGGGVGILGQGANGAARGGGGSGGGSGTSTNGTPGAYGGGAGGYAAGSVSGAVGAVRIIWPGTTRSFPSTNTGNL